MPRIVIFDLEGQLIDSFDQWPDNYTFDNKPFFYWHTGDWLQWSPRDDFGLPLHSHTEKVPARARATLLLMT